ncbi:hypothetical protein CPB86DRAFT_784068 [Serendipita vermifera]|nr:hypothetical protein CPB86DRAFT_784068 [Serendipita vermifera]
MPPKNETQDNAQKLGKFFTNLESASATSHQEGSSQPRFAQPISQDALEKLAERLKELVGEDFDMPNEQLINEDGLPIIEFTEPVRQDYTPSSIPPPPPLRPMPRTEEEHIARRKERDAFLDALEEEERLEEARQTERETETEFMRAVRKAKELAAEIRMEQNTKANTALNRSKETQQGKLQDSDESEGDQNDLPKTVPKKDILPKKNVSFADIPLNSSKPDRNQSLQWGDVQQGRLRTVPGVKSGSDIMKLSIVERIPSTSQPLSPSANKDSDDEDEVEAEGSDVEEAEPDSDDEEIDIDDAMHHREIALRYHELRQTLGAGPRAGPLGGPIEENDDWDQENVPLEASMASGRHDGPKSQFGAPRLTEKVLQAALPNGLQGEFRQGKVMDGELVTNEDDVSSDESLGSRGRRIIEGLKRGLTVEQVMANETDEVESMEEKSKPVPSSTMEGSAGVKHGTAILNEVTEVGERAPRIPMEPKRKPVKVSRFKADRMG